MTFHLDFEWRAWGVLFSLLGLMILPNEGIAKPLTPDEKDMYYTMGVRLSTDLAVYGLSAEAIDEIMVGFKDAHKGSLRLDPGPVFERLKAHLMQLVDKRAAEETTKGHAYMSAFQKDKDALLSPRGAAYKISKSGSGRTPSRKQMVHVHYEGRTVDGVLFDSSRAREGAGSAQPVAFALDQVIPCWTDVLPLIKEGSRVQIVCPGHLAYGKQGAAPVIPPGATLVFDIELLRVGGVKP